LAAVKKKSLYQGDASKVGEEALQGGWSWADCAEYGAGLELHHRRHGCKRSVPYAVDPVASEHLAQAYGNFITVAEVYHAKQPNKLTDKFNKAVGRARGPTFKLVDVTTGCPKARLPVQAASPLLR